MATILVVDDEEFVRDYTKLALERRGHAVHAFESGRNAKTFMEDHDVDLIILDNILKDEIGTEICHQLKTQETTKHIPILMATGNALLKEPTGGNPRHIKPDQFLIKPFEIDALTQMVSHMLDLSCDQ